MTHEHGKPLVTYLKFQFVPLHGFDWNTP